MRKIFRRLNKKERILKDKYLKMREEQAEYTYDKVFTFEHFVDAYKRSLHGVSWKASVQNYKINSVTKLYNDFMMIKERKLPDAISDKEIKIYERGKERIITPIHIKDRVIQKVICDYALVPIISKTLIYDNGASLKDKGVNFSRKRIMHHLKNAIKEYGTNFYVLSFDFKSYFDSIPHKTCRNVLKRYVYDKEIIEMTMQMIKSYKRVSISKIKNKKEKAELLRKLDNDELCGICLGSQVSQIMALVIANDIDHYIKDVKKCKYYVRYMDDGIVLLKSKEELKELLAELKEISDVLGLKFNETKTHITKIRKGFTFLKVRYSVTETGKIVKRLTRKGIVRMRRKLKKLKPKVGDGVTLNNVYDSMQSWMSHSEIANSYHTVKSMTKLYNELYDGYKITKKWNQINGGKNSELLQADKWSEYRWGSFP